jgi:hypothetical protein
LTRVVDDILIYGKDEKDLQEKVESFLERCIEHNIYLNPEKIVYNVPQAEFGGLIIDKQGYRIAPHIIAAIRDFPTPKDIGDIRSFHGLVNQLAPYDEKIAQKFAPLRHLLSTKQKFYMTEDDVSAFEAVKQTLSEAPYLAFYQPGKPIELYTDACKTGFGFVVKQLQSDKSWRPIMVGSRTLLEAETRYAPIESKLSALAWALRKARRFLLGAPGFKLYTDHKPLVALINHK